MTQPPHKPLQDLDEDLWEDGPTPTSTPKSRHGSGVSAWTVLGILVAAGAALFIILDGADDAVFAYTVDQAVSQKSDLNGKTFRVRGTVLKGTVEHKPGTVDTKFDLIHEGKQITVTYNKALPDTFDAGVEVIAEGQLNRDGVLKADNIIAKCPSKYEEQAPTAAGGAKHPEHIPRD